MSVSPVGRKRAFRLFLGVLFPCLPLFPLLLGGCGGRTPHIPSSSASEARMTADIRKLLEQREEIVMAGSCRRSLSESTRDACYRYSPVPQRPPVVGTSRKISRTTPAKTVKNVGKMAGSALLLDRRRNIRSGHVIYVEETCRLKGGN